MIDLTETDVTDVARGSTLVDGENDSILIDVALLEAGDGILPGQWHQIAKCGDRREGTRNLVDVALAGRVGVFVYPGVALVYPDSGDTWVDASSTQPSTVAFLHSTLDAEAEVARFATSGRRGVSLRMGSFYGPESSQTQELIAYARRGFAVVLGRADAYQSSIWVPDAARAVVAAMERAPSGVYDVVDDEPLRRAEVVTLMAGAVGRKRLFRVPGFVATLSVGSTASRILGRSQRVTNRRFKEATGWEPAVASARAGWAILADATPVPAIGAKKEAS